MTGSRHAENCKQCKNNIGRLLRRVYGTVREQYAFDYPADLEGYQGTGVHDTLQAIHSELRSLRGFKTFVHAKRLPPVDYFVPVPGFIVELDERQHFTQARRMSLLNYPAGMRLGFDKKRWIELCERLNRKDNDPPYRDEQRAWYDTLRDFLPTMIQGLSPTVRLYAGQSRWCELDPRDPRDVARFRAILRGSRENSDTWVATVLVQTEGDHCDNRRRSRAFSRILQEVADRTEGAGVLLFPAGWFNAGKRSAKSRYGWVERTVSSVLRKIRRRIVVAVGLDGRSSKDQIALAIDRSGILALARKFHPTKEERGHIHAAPSYRAKEEGRKRVFALNHRSFFLCVCYDSFGIRQEELESPGVDIVLDLIHGFYPRPEKESGDVYFAKNGLAAASKQWDSMVFGAAAFFSRPVPERWPSGVYWNQGEKSIKSWQYDDNPLRPQSRFPVPTIGGLVADIRVFRI